MAVGMSIRADLSIDCMQTAIGAVTAVASTGLVLGVAGVGTAAYCKANGVSLSLAPALVPCCCLLTYFVQHKSE